MKILLADDHELIRKGIKGMITACNPHWQVAGVGSLPAVLERLTQDTAIELLLLDLYLPGASGLDGLGRVKREHPGVAVVIISSEETPEIVADAIRQGASGYIPKSTSNALLMKALELVVSGGVYVPPQALWGQGTAAEVPSPANAPATAVLAGLSDNQQKIARLVAQGMSNRQIATETGLALQTVKNQVSRILRVLNLDSRTALAASLAR